MHDDDIDHDEIDEQHAHVDEELRDALLERDAPTCDEHERVNCAECLDAARRLLAGTPVAVTIDGLSRHIASEADTGDRLYAIDENGDGWRIIVERPLVVDGDGILLVQLTCDTLRVDEWSNWRTAVVDLVPLTATWTEPERGEVPAREHVLALSVIVAGWS